MSTVEPGRSKVDVEYVAYAMSVCAHDEARRLALSVEPEVSTKANAESASQSVLREVICAYVRSLREADVPPERVIIRVKEMLAHTPRPQPPVVHDTLKERVVRWSIEEYYRAD
jgi:hypothetical protein